MIAKKPPMGWNSWDCFGGAVNEERVRKNAEYMAANLKELGWEYIVVDIQWYEPNAADLKQRYAPFADLVMDEYGRLMPDEQRFPSAKDGNGFKKLAEYIHDLGLKFGIHIMRGMPRMAAHYDMPIKNSIFTAREVANSNSICAWNPDMYGLKCEANEEGALAYYQSIFKLYAEWGVDFVKVDDIAREYPHCQREIELISIACRDSGREMVLSLSPGPAPLQQAEHLKKYANMWRITDDFWDQWPLLLEMFDRAEEWCTHSGPGHWPDADMLPLGALRQDKPDPDLHWTKFREAEQITMMTLWCMMRSPLMIGADMPQNDEFTLNLLTNKKVLDITKNTYCAHQLYRTESEVAWIAPKIHGTDCYIALFNVSDISITSELDLSKYDIEVYEIAEELWTNEKVQINDKTLEYSIESHGAVVFELK